MTQLRVVRDTGQPRTRPDAVRGDKAHSSRAIREDLRSRGSRTLITEPDDQKAPKSVADPAAEDQSGWTPPTTRTET